MDAQPPSSASAEKKLQPRPIRTLFNAPAAHVQKVKEYGRVRSFLSAMDFSRYWILDGGLATEVEKRGFCIQVG